MALVTFHKYSAAKNDLERRLIASIGTCLEGDWMSGPPGLDEMYWRCEAEVKEALAKPTNKYANPLKVIRETDHVYIVRERITTGKTEKLCGFERIKTNSINQQNSEMAKTKSETPLKKGIAALLEKEPPLKTEVQYIALSKIYVSETNPRKSFNDDSLKDLADSMKEFGLIQPITIRKLNGEEDGLFEIVAGERRYRAAKLLGWSGIPALIREVSDDQILEIQIIENLQREDVSPLDEAHAFKTLLAKQTKDWLCSRIHKSRKYVEDRLKLNDLIEDAHEYVHSGVLPLTHAIMIAKVPEDQQQACLEECIQEDFRTDYEPVCCKTTAELREFIERKMVDFYNACFDLDDETLVPEAGSCAACDKRTCNQNLLFSEITEDDMCTDAPCFQSKVKAHIDRSMKQAKDEHEKVYAGELAGTGFHGTVKVQGVEVKYSEEKTKTMSACVVLTKVDRYGIKEDRLGQKVYIAPASLEKKKKGMAEQKASGSGRGGQETYFEREKREFKETVYPRLLKITELIEKGALNEDVVQKIALEYLLEHLEDVATNAVVGLAALLGLHPIGGSPEILYDCDANLDKTKRVEIIEKLINHIGRDKIGTLIAILQLLSYSDSSASQQIRTDEQRREPYNNIEYNWPEMMALIEAPAAKTNSPKKGKKAKA